VLRKPLEFVAHIGRHGLHRRAVDGSGILAYLPREIDQVTTTLIDPTISAR
jgi:hypothetical protein